MDLKTFKDSLAAEEPPGVNTALQALWYEGKGDWKAAHDLLQGENGGAGAWVHAYLHRKEGDDSNAAYWYRRAERPVASGSFEAEWDAMAESLLRQS